MRIARKFVFHLGGGVIIIAVISTMLFFYSLGEHIKGEGISSETVREVMNEEFGHLLIVAGSIIFAALVLFFIQLALFSKKIARPLKEAVRFSNALSKGDFTAKLPPEGKDIDEVSDLLRALNHMKDRMQNSIMKLEKSNVREQSARKEAESANLLKSDFMANLSLEFRNPLNSIMGFSSLLLKEAENGKYDESLKMKAKAILRGSEALNNLITNLLELSKMDSKRVEVNVREFETAALIKDVVTYQMLAAEEKNISLESHYSSEAPDTIMTDRDILFQTLGSIISCMIKNSEHEDTVSLGCEKDNGKVVIWIKGSHDADSPSLAEIFNRYKDYKSGELPSFSGATILSLIISKANASLLGAELEAREDNNTCVFNMSFNADEVIPPESGRTRPQLYATNTRSRLSPAEKADVGRARDESSEPGRPGEKTSFSVLLADDNESNRFLLELMLKDSEFELDSVAEGVACLEFLARKKYDMLILDLQMPNLDGYSVLERIRKDSALKGLPIIVVSAYIEEKDKARLFELGADECLLKPLNIEAVMKALRKMSKRGGVRLV